MRQLRDFADPRLLLGCVYCGGPAETREHVPSRVLLDTPYPDNLPVVGACRACNNGFSLDEEYVACLVDVARAESTDPGEVEREAVSKILRRSGALRARLEKAKQSLEGRVAFQVEQERLQTVMLKLARGHAAFELSLQCRENPDHFWCLPIDSLSPDDRASFDAAHVVGTAGEVGSRNTQRMQVVSMTLQSESGETRQVGFVVNDWLDVQDGRYRYLAADDSEGVRIRMVLSEYLACEVAWFRHPTP